ncbi:MAG TPA: hypothetical protein VJH03_09990 [Blastocatellia bacterium]|nr:hypothetical protein [Blastocatellia bacterium]
MVRNHLVQRFKDRREISRLQRDKSRWMTDALEARDEERRLRRDLDKLTRMTPSERDRLQRDIAQQVARSQQSLAEAEEDYERRQEEIEARIKAALETQLRAEEATAQATRTALQAKAVAEAMDGHIHEQIARGVELAEARGRRRNQLLGFFVGVVSSIVASLIMYYLLGTTN